MYKLAKTSCVKARSLLLALAVMVGYGSVEAMAINQSARGKYDQFGGFSRSGRPLDETNYLTGFVNSIIGFEEYRSFFVFDLPPVGAQVLSASLEISNVEAGRGDEREILALFDFGGSIEDLINQDGGVQAFDDLGSGTMYGQRSIFVGAINRLSIPLNQSALFAIQAAWGSTIVIGGALISRDGPADREEFLFSTTQGARPIQLLITVPEPSPLSLLVLSLGIVGLVRHRGGWMPVEAPSVAAHHERLHDDGRDSIVVNTAGCSAA